ncbi:hypothetical protein [Priestia megaterium]|uniref:Uncharacterized protein n=1 Tax=Priestia megaterium TaxID=1404 RepID=A0A6M6DZK4_PRIMG|nr:hypothetical protein [Priestia megaterium]QJX80030.1 hypothetical protein FDZ14_28410 [Priestia megaterium]
MKKLAWVVVFMVTLLMVAACSNSEQTANESAGSENEETKENKATSEKELEEPSDDDSDKETTINTSEDKDVEETPVEAGYELTKRNEVLYKTDKGKITLLGDGIDDEGHIVSAISFSESLKDVVISDSAELMSFTYILDDSSSILLQYAGDQSGYRFNNNEKIVLLKSSESVQGTPVRLDYALEPVDQSGDEPNELDKFDNETTHKIKLDSTSEKIKIDDLLEVKSYSKEINITHKNDKKEITLKSFAIDPSDPNKVTFTGTATYKEDTADPEINIVRPASNFRYNSKLTESSNYTSDPSLYADIPLDFEIEVDLETPIGNDGGSLLYVAIDDLLFPIDLSSGKEYTGDIRLVDLPRLDDTAKLFGPTYKGIASNDGDTLYNVISSSHPSWNYGINTNERETVHFVTGGLFEKLNVDIATGYDFRKQGGNYDLFFYDDEFKTVQDSDEVLGNILYKTQLKSDSEKIPATVDLNDVNNLTFFYNSNQPAGAYSGDGEHYVNVLLSNGILKRK